MGQVSYSLKQYIGDQGIHEAVKKAAEPIIEDAFAEHGAETRGAMANLYRHAAHEIRRTYPEMPLRAAVALLRSEVAHTIA